MHLQHEILHETYIVYIKYLQTKGILLWKGNFFVNSPSKVYITFIQTRGVYYQNNWYFCPPLFRQSYFFPKDSKKFLFSPFFPSLNPYMRVFFYKSSYFSPNLPKTHIFAPPGAGGGGKVKNIHPLFKPVNTCIVVSSSRSLRYLYHGQILTRMCIQINFI